MQRMLNKLVAVFEQIGAKLPACTREVMQGVQIKLTSKLPDYAIGLEWLADYRGTELVLALGSGSRITAEGCREPVDVRIRPLVCCFRMFVLG